jgi:deazaflavin-dependent oxidoreductase (nitroreductase family)
VSVPCNSDGVSEEVIDNPAGWVAEHIRRYVESDGEKGHRFYGHDALLLTTRGRRSGKLHRTALYYGRDGDRYVLVASNGGSRGHPAWYLNLVAHPEIEVQVGAEKFSARAHPASVSERPRLWELMTGIFRKYESYQKKTERELPVVILEPV